MKLLTAKTERVWRTYLGGMQLDRLDGVRFPEDGQYPEAWVLSDIAAEGPDNRREGLCTVEGTNSKITLADAISANPEGILGKAHVKLYGKSMGVLVKLIDSAERLTIQVHPDKNTAFRYFNSSFGKTECWHIMETRDAEVCVYLGFRRDVKTAEVRKIFEEENYEVLLDQMNKIYVKPSDTLYVPGGVPHAIGAGCFLIEIQEPTDYTLRLEKRTPGGMPIPERLIHQGIGYENLFDCIDCAGYAPEAFQITSKSQSRNGYTIQWLVNYETSPCFSMAAIVVEDTLPWPTGNQFWGIYVVEGRCIVKSGTHHTNLRRHTCALVSAQLEQFTITNTGTKPAHLILFTGPAY